VGSNAALSPRIPEQVMEKKYAELLLKKDNLLGLSKTSDFFGTEAFNLQKLNNHKKKEAFPKQYGISLLKDASASLQSLEDSSSSRGKLDLDQIKNEI
jgi:hypothetical protein